MISEKYRCIFVHIPKTAGQSIEDFFLKLHGLTWDAESRASLLLKYNTNKKKGPERLAHLTAEEYVRFGYIDKKNFHSYFKFSFVRNPWARLVSEYNYRCYYKKYSFKNFVLNELPKNSQYTDSYRHIMPQYDFLHDEQGRCIVDFIGKFEKLQKDFSFVCSRLNIEKSILNHLNSSSHEKSSLKYFSGKYVTKPLSSNGNYSEYYDKETVSIINNIYSKDISKFKYEFGD